MRTSGGGEAPKELRENCFEVLLSPEFTNIARTPRRHPRSFWVPFSNAFYLRNPDGFTRTSPALLVRTQEDNTFLYRRTTHPNSTENSDPTITPPLLPGVGYGYTTLARPMPSRAVPGREAWRLRRARGLANASLHRRVPTAAEPSGPGLSTPTKIYSRDRGPARPNTRGYRGLVPAGEDRWLQQIGTRRLWRPSVAHPITCIEDRNAPPRQDGSGRK